ncbi:DedA family protein [Paraliobacillus ryukyuensis]|uniref:DedA family protein n=1 Tax=Paraliobacillus ryukyuensis TaxID=200904 RepID=UPI0009A703FD|nr:DedA family protein [Paraliobacillus ryukyuensis]
MQDWLMTVINSYGYMGIAFLIAVENIFPPIPSEIILTFGGFLTTSTSMSLTGVVVAATIGSVFGAVVLYLIGASISKETLKKFINKRGHYLRLEVDDVDRAIGWFHKYGGWSVFVCRFIPLIRSLISIPAGLAQMQFWPFLLLTTTGTLIWNVVLVSLGAYVGESWQDIVIYMDRYSLIMYGLLAVVVIIGIGIYLKRRK